MTYAIILITDFGTEIRLDIRGTVALEKYTNERIMNIYEIGKEVTFMVGNMEVKATVKQIIKVYPNSRCEELKKGEVA